MANFGDNLLKGIGGLASLAGVTLPFLGIKAQANENMRLAQFQAQQNQRYLDQQLEYNSPKAQMARFKEAGLNPNLIYGQGTSGNQSAPLTYPEVRPRDFSQLLSIAPTLNQSMLAQSQVQAQQVRSVKDLASTELARAQKELVDRNPYMNDSVIKSMVSSWESAAKIKASQASIIGLQAEWGRDMQGRVGKDGSMNVKPNAFHKMDLELDTLFQKYHLDTADGRLKAATLKSKQFQNDLNDIQLKWMRDGEVNPQILLMFILSLINKL